MRKMNNKGQAQVMVYIALALLVIYLILFIPIPSFTALRLTVNYFLIIGVWLLLQTVLVYGYYQIGRYSFKGISLLKNKVFKMNDTVERYITMHHM